MTQRFRVLRSRSIYQGKVVSLRVDRVREPGGALVEREVIGHPGSVVVLPRLSDGRVLLIRQFRYAAGKSLWELVAGGIEDGETLREAARRELREETGYSARIVKPRLGFFPSPGILSERMHLVEARGLTKSEAQPEADERIRCAWFTPAALRRMIHRKRIEDGKTLVGLAWLGITYPRTI